ncbi:MAG TPA: alkaline phosphatase family protein [Vicinamibacterales bacterium]|nr:alkaline phosphatase family protein [Vicinamibacterales bacterium]
MRFLRMLTNSLLAGALGAAYLTVLVLHLNPDVPLASATTWRWFVTLGLFYGIHMAVVIYALLVAREFFSMEPLSPGWASVRVLAWLASALSASAALLMWLNVGGFEPALGETAVRRMRAGAASATVAAAALLVIAVAHYSFGRRGSRVGASLFALAVVGSLALPLAARGPAPPAVPPAHGTRPSLPPAVAPEPSVTLLLLDGASLEFLWPRVAEGRLPHFARLLEGGATLDLATIRPTGPGPVWAAVATGMHPYKNGVRSGARYYARLDSRAIDLLPDHCLSHALVRLGIVRSEPATSAAWRARPFWSLLTDAGIPVGIVRWPLTYPAEPVDGFMVSDRFHELLGSVLELDERAAYPAAALAAARGAFTQPIDDDAPAIAPASSQPADAPPEALAGLRDRRYSLALREIRSRTPVRLAAIRYQGLDTVGHLYGGDAQPGVLSRAPESERRRRLQVLDRYYAYIDAEAGAAMDSLDPGDLLLVVSGFGIERQSAIKQIAGRLAGDLAATGSHERAPDGFMLAYGTTVEPGRYQRGSIVDVTPTVLYFLGLPVGRDMDGYARTDIFTRAFTAERPIAVIPSYNR